MEIELARPSARPVGVEGGPKGHKSKVTHQLYLKISAASPGPPHPSISALLAPHDDLGTRPAIPPLPDSDHSVAPL
jgi:hypothetical protein